MIYFSSTDFWTSINCVLPILYEEYIYAGMRENGNAIKRTVIYIQLQLWQLFAFFQTENNNKTEAEDTVGSGSGIF